MNATCTVCRRQAVVSLRLGWFSLRLCLGHLNGLHAALAAISKDAEQ